MDDGIVGTTGVDILGDDSLVVVVSRFGGDRDGIEATDTVGSVSVRVVVVVTILDGTTGSHIIVLVLVRGFRLRLCFFFR